MFRQKLRPISWSKTLWNLKKLAISPSSNMLKVHSFQYAEKLDNPLHTLVSPSSGSLTSRKYFCTERQLSESEYEELADDTLDSLTEKFEDLQEKFDLDPDYDVTFNSGVLTVKISSSWGTYVINKQTPNKQIWFSSPKSGPKRYDYMDGVWIYKHDQSMLHELLNEEVSEAISQAVDFTNCSYGKR